MDAIISALEDLLFCLFIKVRYSSVLSLFCHIPQITHNFARGYLFFSASCSCDSDPDYFKLPSYSRVLGETRRSPIALRY